MIEVTIIHRQNGLSVATGFYLGNFYKYRYIGHSEQYIKDHFRKWVKEQHATPV